MMSQEFKTKIFILGLCFALIFVVSRMPLGRVNAQTINSLFDIQEELDLSVTPSNPQVGDIVTANVQAPGTNLDNNTIYWYVNGSLKTSGVGIKTFTTTAPALGASMIIEVRVKTDAGDIVQKSFTLSTQDLDIIWETDSYTPPFYKGKALYGQEGNIAFVAMPNIVGQNGAKIPASNLVYKWIIDDSVVGDKSGYGKNVFYYSGSILAQPTKVQVDVTASDGTNGQGFLVIAPQTPQTILYEDDPLYGVMFNNAITNGFKLKGTEIRVDAYPYFQSAGNKTSSNLSYAWALNSNPIPVPSQKNSAVFRNSNNLNGTSLISVITDNSTHILQQSQTSASLNF